MGSPEIPPPVFGAYRGVAFIEGPLESALGEFLGRLIPFERGVDAILRVLPLPALQAALKAKKTKDKLAEKRDGWTVVKVHDAITIVDEELRGFVGGVNEIGDFVAPFGPPVSGEGAISLPDRIAQRIRDAALQQKNSRLTGSFNVTKAQDVSAFGGPHTNKIFPEVCKQRRGSMHHDKNVGGVGVA